MNDLSNSPNITPINTTPSSPSFNPSFPSSSALEETQPFFKMTLEFEKGKHKHIKIFPTSDPDELSFNFCKENNLDFTSMKYLKEEITKLLNKFAERKLLYSNNSIQEVEEENFLTEKTFEQKHSERSSNAKDEDDDDNDIDKDENVSLSNNNNNDNKRFIYSSIDSNNNNNNNKDTEKNGVDDNVKIEPAFNVDDDDINNNTNSNCPYKTSTTESNANTNVHQFNTADQLHCPLPKQLPTTSSIDNKSLPIKNKSTYEQEQLHSHPQDANAVVDGLLNMSSKNSSINSHSKRQVLKQNTGLYRETISDKKSISIGNDGETNKSNASSITKKSFPRNKSKDEKPIAINKQDNEEYDYAMRSNNVGKDSKMFIDGHHHMNMQVSKTLNNNKKEHSLLTQGDVDNEQFYITKSDKYGCSSNDNNEHMLNGYMDISSLLEIKKKKDMIDMQMEEEHRMELLALQQAQTKSFAEDSNNNRSNIKQNINSNINNNSNSNNVAVNASTKQQPVQTINKHKLVLDEVDYNFPLEEIDSSEFNENIDVDEGSDENESPQYKAHTNNTCIHHNNCNCNCNCNCDDDSKSTRHCVHKPQTPQQQQQQQYPSVSQSQRSRSKYSSLNLNVSLSQKAPSISSSTNTANKDKDNMIPHASTNTNNNTTQNHCTSSLNKDSNNNNTVSSSTNPLSSSLTSHLFSQTQQLKRSNLPMTLHPINTNTSHIMNTNPNTTNPTAQHMNKDYLSNTSKSSKKKQKIFQYEILTENDAYDYNTGPNGLANTKNGVIASNNNYTHAHTNNNNNITNSNNNLFSSRSSQSIVGINLTTNNNFILNSCANTGRNNYRIITQRQTKDNLSRSNSVNIFEKLFPHAERNKFSRNQYHFSYRMQNMSDILNQSRNSAKRKRRAKTTKPKVAKVNVSTCYKENNYECCDTMGMSNKNKNKAKNTSCISSSNNNNNCNKGKTKGNEVHKEIKSKNECYGNNGIVLDKGSTNVNVVKKDKERNNNMLTALTAVNSNNNRQQSPFVHDKLKSKLNSNITNTNNNVINTATTSHKQQDTFYVNNYFNTNSNPLHSSKDKKLKKINLLSKKHFDTTLLKHKVIQIKKDIEPKQQQQQPHHQHHQHHQQQQHSVKKHIQLSSHNKKTPLHKTTPTNATNTNIIMLLPESRNFCLTTTTTTNANTNHPPNQSKLTKKKKNYNIFNKHVDTSSSTTFVNVANTQQPKQNTSQTFINSLYRSTTSTTPSNPTTNPNINTHYSNNPSTSPFLFTSPNVMTSNSKAKIRTKVETFIKVFDSIDKDKDGFITFEDVLKCKIQPEVMELLVIPLLKKVKRTSTQIPKKKFVDSVLHIYNELEVKQKKQLNGVLNKEKCRSEKRLNVNKSSDVVKVQKNNGNKCCCNTYSGNNNNNNYNNYNYNYNSNYNAVVVGQSSCSTNKNSKKFLSDDIDKKMIQSLSLNDINMKSFVRENNNNNNNNMKEGDKVKREISNVNSNNRNYNGNVWMWENDKGNVINVNSNTNTVGNVVNVNNANGVKFPGNYSTSNKYKKNQSYDFVYKD